MKAIHLFLMSIISISIRGMAQEDMPGMPGMHHKVQKDSTSKKNEGQMNGMNMGRAHHGAKMAMSSAFSQNLPMNRDGSGTAWNPDATPMYAYMVHAGPWMFMFHGNVFIRYDKQDLANAGHRGGEKWDAPDMLMAMGQRKLGEKGLLHFSTMFSTDAIIAGGSGYPLIFQTGESWHGAPLVDRQHPHDLFSELSVSYAYSFSKKADAFAYVGYPGEPALGPVTFMHRPSGEFMPDAPIGHHWEDATHITFGVATVGFRYGKFKLEGSSFTGREPDENRYNFDQPRFDSWSGRLSCNPTRSWALQVSHGYLKSPEALRPWEDVNRTTASATYVHTAGMQRFFAATVLWGQNVIPNENPSNSALIEATFKAAKLALYTRYEWVQKSADELALDPFLFFHPEFNLNTFTLGAGYDLFRLGYIEFAGGLQGTINYVSGSLQPLYGNNPLAAEVYVHIYPKKMM